MSDHQVEDRYWESTNGGSGRTEPRAWAHSDAAALSLDGRWRFRLWPTAKGGGEAPLEPEFDDSTWDEIQVPSHWVLEDVTVPWADEPKLPAPRLDEHGPLYTNTAFPIPIDPPYVPDDAPTADYRLRFDLPRSWPLDQGALLRFGGVDSCGAVWLNGQPVGWSTGSRLPVEYPVGALLKPGGNVLVVRVHRWSAGTYLEDQDMWWLPGIFRGVDLLHRPADGIGDHRVVADYDHRDGSGTLLVETDVPAELEIPELGIRTRAGRTLRVDRVEPWSAETPRLYHGTLRTPGETVSLRIGFRTVRIEDGRLLVNGVPVLFRGVNRHEHDAERGRALDVETMREDVVLMKRAGVNAVRTSHYPPHPAFIELCDEYGLWVVAEADVETHGFVYAGWEGNPPAEPRWHGAILDRIRRTVERDKNAPSVVVWSLGNESDSGEAFMAARAWLRERDPSRPVLYERDPSYAPSDFYSVMYPALDALEAIGRRQEPTPEGIEPGSPADVRRRDLPFLLVEYAHAMGNGPGSLLDYREILESYERFCGGFVWEWIDHGFAAVDPQGRRIFAHGADVSYRPNGGRFCLDGILNSDRSPTPAYAELAAAFAVVRFGFDLAAGTVRIRNAQDTTDTSAFAFTWTVESDGTPVRSGTLAVPPTAPRADRDIELPAEGLVGERVPDGSAEEWLTVTAVLQEAAPWAPAGHVVGSGQVRVGSRPHTTAARADSTPAHNKPSQQGTWPSGGELSALVRHDGAINRITELLGIPVEGVMPDVWRAPTENDRGQGARNNAAGSWKAVGLDRFLHRTLGVSHDEDTLRVRVRSGPATQTIALWTGLTWTATAGGGVDLDASFDFTGHWDDTPHGHHTVRPPRLGLRLGLPGSYDSVEWFGRGPGQSYADACAASRVGRFSAGIDALQVPFEVPQENGNHLETRWLVLRGPGVPALRVEAAPGTTFDFTARPWTSEALERARHPVDLVRSGTLWLNLDVRQRGLGSSSCGPALPARYEVPLEPAALKVRFRLAEESRPSRR
ncbi:glycoside hydrolase family 2 TIM barrel-domain containing protein [Streptomyces sp. NPDC002795]|uniref:glycoside hydrolase family 2 TIM barrel-domain containing protein n=1 Tax=Streptomyces sp. NPDC002795 TaxID=3364665 RepID=UPI0036A14535